MNINTLVSHHDSSNLNCLCTCLDGPAPHVDESTNVTMLCGVVCPPVSSEAFNLAARSDAQASDMRLLLRCVVAVVAFFIYHDLMSLTHSTEYVYINMYICCVVIRVCNKTETAISDEDGRH